MQRDRDVEPERSSGNGGSSPGADPDQDDHRTDSPNGDPGQRDDD